MAREVWFQLVQVSEDQQGMPFSGVSEDAVQLTDDIRDVRNLREAIREKYRHEKPDSMEGVAPNQLRIYANEAAYKAKKPCSPRSSLNDLDMRAIFIVEVRLQQPQRPVLEIPQVDWTAASNILSLFFFVPFIRVVMTTQTLANIKERLSAWLLSKEILTGQSPEIKEFVEERFRYDYDIYLGQTQRQIDQMDSRFR
ncbi:hypothetical protein JG687_00006376 [Phytophthora cactorum]|uniref:Uncharacterized protein n=1 Tax=Phytophthora cactorum TaxID=29920 RepID=A0A8T1UMT9_9STRA|nr:hypothetical protein JG687_00006376 [Phytophthora cactorum]